MVEFPDYKVLDVEKLVPYARNSRTHTSKQVDKIAASIREFRFLNPVIVDEAGGIIAGHARVMAAKKLGLEQVPCIEAAHLTEAQRKAYVIADNRLAEDAGWDNDLLKIELEELQRADFDLSLTGFSVKEQHSILELEEDDDERYTKKTTSPVYEPSGEQPPVADLYDSSKHRGLVEQIKSSGLPGDEQEFLIAAASRHIRFDFEAVANYYAHASEECQRLMEASALVIVDFEQAIELGYVRLTEELREAYAKEKGGDG